MAAVLTCAVIVSLAGLIAPPALKIIRLGREGRMELRPVRQAFAPE
ncbi:hypothetical protein [Microvirga sp. KLBC 81]|nr:hypothetical protein [Microvirga sp. KLBC 81]